MVASSPLQFLRSFSLSWGALVSGSLSIPFTVAALFGKDYDKEIWGLLALTAVIISAYFVWKTVYDELAALKAPDISVLFDAHDERCMTPVLYQPSTSATAIFYPTAVQAGTSFRQACIVLENTSGVQIDNVEIYCEEIRIENPNPETYLLIPNGGFRAIHLCAGEPFRQGIIRESVETDDNGTAISKRIELTLPYKPQARNLKGSEFTVKVLIVGRNLHKPKRQTYRFGDRHGKLFFEEA